MSQTKHDAPRLCNYRQRLSLRKYKQKITKLKRKMTNIFNIHVDSMKWQKSGDASVFNA